VELHDAGAVAEGLGEAGGLRAEGDPDALERAIRGLAIHGGLEHAAAGGQDPALGEGGRQLIGGGLAERRGFHLLDDEGGEILVAEIARGGGDHGGEDRAVEGVLLVGGEGGAGFPERPGEQGRVLVDLAAEGGGAGVLVIQRADGRARAEIARGILADVRVTREDRGEVIGQRLVHPARGDGHAEGVVVRGADEVDGGVDDAVGQLVVDDIAVVGVILLRALAEPHGAAGDREDLGKELVVGREEGVLEGLEGQVGVGDLLRVEAPGDPGGDAQVGDGIDRLLLYQNGRRIPPEEVINPVGVVEDGQLAEGVLGVGVGGGLLREIALVVRGGGLLERADVDHEREAHDRDALDLLLVEAIAGHDQIVGQGGRPRREGQHDRRQIGGFDRVGGVHLRRPEGVGRAVTHEDLAAEGVDDHDRGPGQLGDRGVAHHVDEPRAVLRGPDGQPRAIGPERDAGRRARHPRRRRRVEGGPGVAEGRADLLVELRGDQAGGPVNAEGHRRSPHQDRQTAVLLREFHDPLTAGQRQRPPRPERRARPASRYYLPRRPLGHLVARRRRRDGRRRRARLDHHPRSRGRPRGDQQQREGRQQGRVSHEEPRIVEDLVSPDLLHRGPRDVDGSVSRNRASA
jgi:hypothetical protein